MRVKEGQAEGVYSMTKESKSYRFLQKNAFWLGLAFLLHFLLFLSMSAHFTFPKEEEKKPSLYISSYTYVEPTPPILSSPLIKNNEILQKEGIQHAASSTFSPSTPQNKMKAKDKSTEDIHLIGDKKTDAPLIKLLGKALTAHLLYPKAARDFYIRGTVYVRFMIHPDGEITDIQLLQSSGASVLDDAAMSGIRAMSPIQNVSHYLSVAKYLVVGVIF